MKTKITLTLSIVAILTALLSVSSLAGVGPLANHALQAGAPSVVSYQGQVTVGGSAYNGSGYFKFAIVNAAGDSTYWSNDGTSADGAEPTNGTPLPVSNGLFNVLLGDTSLTNMTQPLSASVFSGTNRYLRVWFSADDSTYQLLSPDQRIAAVPYALQAQEAANADTLDGADASAFADASHAHDGLLPTGAMVLSKSDSDTTLINAGLSFTGMVFEPDWFAKADMLTGRYGLAAAAVGGVIYAIGGNSSSNPYETANQAYDPATNSWSNKAPMPTGRRYLTTATVDGVIYAIGGVSSSTAYERVNQAYDPATNSWSNKAPMPTGRYRLAAAAVDGVIYAIGGSSSSTAHETANQAYDPAANSWSNRVPMTTGREGLAAAVVDGVIYAIGGVSSSTTYETVNQAYDPAASSWSDKAPMTTGRGSLAAATMDGVIYAIGGISSVNPLETANQAYNPATNSWTTKEPMTTGRYGLTATAVDGVIYAIGGWSYTNLYETKNEAYVPALYIYTKD
jgi:N-acetylneuraminic acid mutarotase